MIGYMVDNRFFDQDNMDNISHMICQYALGRLAQGDNEIYVEMVLEHESPDAPYLTWYHNRRCIGENGVTQIYIYSEYLAPNVSDVDNCWNVVKNVSTNLKTMLDGSGIAVTPSKEHGWSFFCISRGELMADF